MTTFDQMIDRGHELVCYHQDPASGLRAIVAIHSTALGPGFGGARRWCYATEADAIYDVLRLSEGMTYKAAGANVPIGGAKAVVLLPRPGFKATEAEARALGRFVDTLGGRYLSAEDVGLTPRYIDWMARETRWVTGGDESGSGGDPSPHTALGVVNAMRAALAHTGRAATFDGVTVAVQGAGNVGSHVTRLLLERGANVLLADLNEERVAALAALPGVTAVGPDEIVFAECDILAPCALGGVVSAKVIRKLRCEIICGGANNVLDDYDEDAVALKAGDITYVPDFIANAGGLIELAGGFVGMTPEQRRDRVAGIEDTTFQILRDAESHPSTYAAALSLARQRIAENASVDVAAG